MHERDLDNLEDWIRRLKVEYEIYFNGNRRRPPDDLRARVEKLAKRLSEAAEMTYSDRFRYNTLVARFYLYRDLWRRQMQDRELGLGPREEVAEREIAQASKPVRKPPERIRISIADPEAEEEKVRQLYQSLLSLRGMDPGTPLGISYQQFVKYIAGRTQNIRAKYGCPSVMFIVALEEDAIRFTAKPETNR